MLVQRMAAQVVPDGKSKIRPRKSWDPLLTAYSSEHAVSLLWMNGLGMMIIAFFSQAFHFGDDVINWLLVDEWKPCHRVLPICDCTGDPRLIMSAWQCTHTLSTCGGCRFSAASVTWSALF